MAVYILNILNPTTNNQIGDIKNISIVNIDDFMKNEIVKKVDKNVNLSTNDWDSFETSWDFKKNPLV